MRHCLMSQPVTGQSTGRCWTSNKHSRKVMGGRSTGPASCFICPGQDSQLWRILGSTVGSLQPVSSRVCRRVSRDMRLMAGHSFQVKLRHGGSWHRDDAALDKGEDDNTRAMICGLAVALSHRRSLSKKLFPNTVTLPIFPYF